MVMSDSLKSTNPTRSLMRLVFPLVAALILPIQGCGKSDPGITGAWVSGDGLALVRGFASALRSESPSEAASLEPLEKALNGGKPFPRREIAALVASSRVDASLELRADSIAVLQLSSPDALAPAPVVFQFLWEMRGAVVHLHHGVEDVPQAFTLADARLVSTATRGTERIVFYRTKRR